MLGGVDSAILERLVKVMSYMRVTAGVKPGKRLKKKEKLRMLAGGDISVRPLNGARRTSCTVKQLLLQCCLVRCTSCVRD